MSSSGGERGSLAARCVLAEAGSPSALCMLASPLQGVCTSTPRKAAVPKTFLRFCGHCSMAHSNRETEVTHVLE